MPIDPSIALGVKPVEIESPINQHAKLLQLQSLMNTNQLDKLKIEEARQEVNNLNKLRDYTSGVTNLDSPEVVNALSSQYGKPGQEILKAYQDRKKSMADLNKINVDTILEATKLSKERLAGVTNLEQFLEWHDQNHKDPNLGPYLRSIGSTKEAAQKRIQEALATGKFDQLLNEAKLGVDKFLENQFINQDMGGSLRTIVAPKYGPGSANVLPGSEVTVTRSPNAPRTTIYNNVKNLIPASNEAQQQYMQSTRATYDTLKQAPAVLNNIEAAKKLIPKAAGFMGTGGEPLLRAASFLNNRLGTEIDTQGITSAEELKSRLFFGILDNLKKLDAQPSERQQAALQEALGNLGSDPKALPRILDSFGDIVREKVNLYNQEVASASQRGVMFPYDPKIILPKINKSSGSNKPSKGSIVDGYKFMGGNPADKKNWKKL